MAEIEEKPQPISVRARGWAKRFFRRESGVLVMIIGAFDRNICGRELRFCHVDSGRRKFKWSGTDIPF